MSDRKETVARLFWKFGYLSVNELELIFGSAISRRQLNRYLVQLAKKGRIERRIHPSRYVFAYEATPKILLETSRKPIKTFQRQNGREIGHRIACANALVNLCRRSKVQGVTIEHELSPSDLKEFCIGRIPDGIVQIAGLTSDPIEFAVEVENSLKTRARIKEILDGYERTLESKRHRCRGLIVFATEEGILKQYENLIADYPESFRKKVILARGTSTQDIAISVLGEPCASAFGNRHLPCLSRRSSRHGAIEYLQ